MTISPVSAVSFKNNYNQVNFGSKHKKGEEGYSSRPAGSLMKSIPLAALIAMSPLVNTQAQILKLNPNEKTVQSMTYKDVNRDGCNIWFVSNDGNDSNIEAIVLQHGKTYKYARTIRGVRTNLIKRENERQYLDTLKIVHERFKHSDGTISEPETKYVVAGPCIYDVYVDDAASGKGLKHANGKIDHKEYVIDKELYDYLLQFMDKNSVKTVSRTVDAVEGPSIEERILWGM